jgi:hypothetical protein
MKTKVCSLELSRKLADAGVVVETEFVWVNPNGDEWRVQRRSYANPLKETIPAPLACELDSFLPDEIKIANAEYEIIIERWKVKRLVNYTDPSTGACLHGLSADTMSDAMGLMALWLKENGHLEETK